jgi:hypothetical protein
MKKLFLSSILILAITLSGNSQITDATGDQAVDVNGNVLSGNIGIGIGTSNPLRRLTVNSDGAPVTSLFASSATAGAIIDINSISTDGDTYIRYQNNGAIPFVAGYDKSENTFSINSSPVLGSDFNIDINGNVGIGTTNPSEKLDVSSASSILSRYIKIRDYDNNTYDFDNGEGTRFFSRDGNTMFNGGVIVGNYPNGDTNNLNNGELLVKDKLGIGTMDFDQDTDAKLFVDGKILCEEVEVIAALDILPDYVFQKYYTGESSLRKDYVMLTLEEVETFTRENHHLPEVPSAAEIKEEGLQLKEMTTILLQKVEELTLYTIEQEKRIKALEAELAKKQ